MGMKPPVDKDKAGRRSKRYESESSSDKTSPNFKEEKVNSFSKELARLQVKPLGLFIKREKVVMR